MTTDLLTRGFDRARAFEAENLWFEAELVYRQVLRAEPNSPVLRQAWGEFLLRRGDWGAGFAEYEHRLDIPVFRGPRTAPPWEGGDPAGLDLLVAAEQGFGDTIMLARFLPELVRRGARPIFGVPKALARLMRSLEPAVPVIADGDPLLPHRFHVWAYSLPHRLNITPESLPKAPYLAFEPDLKAAFGVAGEGPAVGLCWQGNPQLPTDRQRSIASSRLLPLLDVGGVRFVGLGADATSGEFAAAAGERFVDVGPAHRRSLERFAATAAVIASLDLVISVDTAIAHLAGALGRPCWLLLPFFADWRWGREGESTSWYPSLKLIRAPAPGGAELAVPKAVAMLAAWAGRR